MPTILQSVAIGIAILLAGTLPRNAIFAANLRILPDVPWAVPLTAVYLWLFWQYLRGYGPPPETAETRRSRLRANRVTGRVWIWALLAGGFAIVALVLALQLLNRLISFPEQQLPDLSGVPQVTIVALLIMAAPVAGIVEEASFRGYMQGPIERQFGLPIAILITGTMFALSHLDFTPVLWPYYVAVAAIYSTITARTNSILPAIVLHTAGNLYSNFDLWMYGQAEWQTSSGSASLIWQTGADAAFWRATLTLAVITAATAWCYFRLVTAARAAR